VSGGDPWLNFVDSWDIDQDDSEYDEEENGVSYFDDNEDRLTGLPKLPSYVPSPVPDWCKHEMVRSSCAWCNGKPADREVEQLLGGTDRPGSDKDQADLETRVAMYQGTCNRCHEPFEVGATIGWSRSLRITVGPCCWSPTESNAGGWSS
jgi:hypothetical protein